VVFAALALWAVFLFAAELESTFTAVLATVLLLTNASEVFYGRFLMPEVLTQCFLWSGLLAFVVWRRTGSVPAAGLSGLALGLASLTRVEFLFLLPAPVALYLGLTATHARGTGLFLAAFAGPLLDGFLRVIFVPSHYRDVVWTELARVGRWSLLATDTQALLRDAALLAALAAIVVILRRSRGPRLRRVVTLGAAGAGAGAYLLRSDPHLTLPTIAWLAESVSWPILLGAVAGVVLWLRAPRRTDPAHAFPLLILFVVGGALLYDPHVGRNYLWGIRRLVPLVIPFAYLLAATALYDLTRGLTSSARTAVPAAIGAVLLFWNVVAVSQLRGLALFPDQTRPLQALADAIPARAIVFFLPSLDALMLHVPLWLTHGKESAVLPPWLWKMGLQTTAPGILRRRPVFLVAGDGPAPTIGSLDVIARATVDLQLRTPEPDAEKAPSSAIASPVRLRVFEVRDATIAAP
jgi:hypothetical protein